jgi:hypothetical protein
MLMSYSKRNEDYIPLDGAIRENCHLIQLKLCDTITPCFPKQSAKSWTLMGRLVVRKGLETMSRWALNGLVMIFLNWNIRASTRLF